MTAGTKEKLGSHCFASGAEEGESEFEAVGAGDGGQGSRTKAMLSKHIQNYESDDCVDADQVMFHYLSALNLLATFHLSRRGIIE
ncbi:unnamed protein product [Phytophthora fragariaefolia]|uniref:Unnamed protein product n=1 Tax=Phytophthora fragariaefolia TaxID=1490495 RepID=A0A9W6XI57_9STRA|nr:unnamed protein product [Phytophthora fragariaefolia]